VVEGRLPRTMLNGAIVCLGILAVQLLFAIPAAYALAKLRFHGRGVLFGLVLFGLCVPIQVPALPLYLAFAQAGVLDTFFALMAPFFLSVFGMFLFRQFFRTYPDEVLDAARLDGMGEFEIVWRLATPAALPAIAAFSVFSAVAHWNDLYWPLIVVTSSELATPPLGILAFRDTESGGNYGALMAAAALVTAPLILAFLLARRAFLRGITMTGLR
jgi:multiple sugar transport system permease protein